MKTYSILITIYSVILTVALGLFLWAPGDSDWKKISPFTDVKISNGEIIAQFQGDFYKVKSIEGISSDRIIKVSKSKYEDQWIKRIREDIADVLIAAGAPESNHVDLELEDLKDKKIKSVENAPMTRENRIIIYSGTRES